MVYHFLDLLTHIQTALIVLMISIKGVVVFSLNVVSVSIISIIITTVVFLT